MTPQGPSGPEEGAAPPAVRRAGRVDQRDAFGPTSPRGTLRVADGVLSWQPRGWRAPVWRVAAADLVGGAGSALSTYELWLESAVTGTVALALEPPGGGWLVGGGNVPDLRGQALLEGFVAALRAGGARVVGEPRSMSARPGDGGPVVLWPF